MTIGIIGVGNVGAALGKHWAHAGHEVLFGVRDPHSDKVRQVLDAAGPNARTETIDDISRTTSVLLLATPHSALRAVVEQMGLLRSNILIDCTNPIAPGMRLAVGHSSSGAEQLAGWVKDVPVVKAFNAMGYETMQNPGFGQQAATMFLCGDDKKSNQTVADLATEIGFDAVITGPLRHARYLEPMAMLWIEMANREGYGREMAFKLIRRDQAAKM
jgi:predicted dinucleotide-binding enzyme